ncbi:Qat anti-phage system QueC-like protein QatC [Clostridium sp. VAP23]|uniref:Qat anti-phage system QueC-like protein QatC n=1 Tax=Clostridium sp. VAP23 TaxID=2949981 RepID=UPI0020799C9F|nr:Qat anti-phage system QueC-like protein QatC [Clostridium sp. VAP23]
MKIWIEKCEDEFNEDDEYILFKLNNKNNKSTIKTNMEDLWRRFGVATITDINEDLLIIALSVFGIDKRIPRNMFKDGWTRRFEVEIPVIEIEKWNLVRQELENALGFLSGDVWRLHFRKTDKKFRGNKVSKYNIIKRRDFDCVSLFSGGLDSYSGAIKLLENKQKICFVGFKEYGLLEKRQRKIFDILNSIYKDIEKEIILFNGTPYSPVNNMNQKINYGIESTSRSRSFLFLAGALAVASLLDNIVPVYIPENGFIGLNVNLTMSRKGTCSTRTTHVYFINELNNILKKIGIKNRVENFYAYKSKGEIVNEIKETVAFKIGAKETISCSHPCLARYDKKTPPMNCGYCYPCLIRRASMNKINYYDEAYNDKYTVSKKFIDDYNKIDGKASDLKAVLWSLNRYLNMKDKNEEVRSLVIKTGNLAKEDIEKFTQVYIKSMEELKELIKYEAKKNGMELLEYVGLKEEHE